MPIASAFRLLARRPGNQKRFWRITLAAEFDYKMQPKYNYTYWSTKYENLQSMPYLFYNHRVGLIRSGRQSS
jgi:hypothetical protein